MAAEESWVKGQVKDLMLSFDAADRNGDGFLSMNEVFRMLWSAGYRGDQDEMARIFDVMDRDNDSQVTRQEFYNVLSVLPVVTRREITLMKAFSKIDKDGNGSLTKHEIYEAMWAGKTGLTKEQLDKVFNAAFPEADQAIQYDEFIKALNFNESESVLRKIFDLLDSDHSGTLTAEEVRGAIEKEKELIRVKPYLKKLLDEMEGESQGKPIVFNKFVETWLTRKNYFKK